jgi:hypothetical protein
MNSRRPVNSIVMLLLITGMRILFIAGMLLLANSAAYSQDSAQQFGNTIKREDVLALPPRDRAPQLSLQRALRIAERYARKKRLRVSDCYLFEARLLGDGTKPDAGAWNFWWVSVRHSTPDIHISVSANGKPALFIVYGAT